MRDSRGGNDMGMLTYRDRMYRTATLGGVGLTLLLLIHLTATSSLSRYTLSSLEHGGRWYTGSGSQFDDCDCASSVRDQPPSQQVNQSQLLQITENNRNLVYLHKADILLMTMAKAGTSTTWHWLYPGVTGRKSWDSATCKTYVHDMRSQCWDTHASFVYMLDESEQRRVLFHSNSTLRIAIQRNPYERIISSFKSKFTCEDERFSTDLHNRETMVPQLRRRCRMPSQKSNCMNISEFAQTLDSCRRNVGKDGYIPSLRLLDVHIRPQQFYFDFIDYDMVVDVADLSDVNVVTPIIERIQFKNAVEGGPRVRHSSGDDQLSIPERAGAMLYAYASESKPGRLKYLPGYEPSTPAADTFSVEDDDWIPFFFQYLLFNSLDLFNYQPHYSY